MQSAFAYWEITGKHLLIYSSVTDQSYAQHSSSREMWNHVSISYAGQLCKQPALGREEVEEQRHLTCFSKNTKAQNSFIFSYLTFKSRTKEKEVPTRVKMYSMYMLVFFKKPPSTETTKHCKQRDFTLNKHVYWGCWDFLGKSLLKFLTSFYLTRHNNSRSASKVLDTHYAFHSNPRDTD